jgi:ABC-type amino acid transport substrate-binding protein
MKYFLVIVVLLLPKFGFAQQLSGDTYETAQWKKSAEITVVYLDEDAFAYKNEKGELSGICIDIFDHFTKWLKNSKGIELKVKFIGERSFMDFYSMVQHGTKGVIGLGSTTVLERRKTEVNFTEPYLTNIAVLVTHSSIPTLSKLEESAKLFRNMTAIAGKGMTLESYTKDLNNKYLPNQKMEYVITQSEIIDRIESDINIYGYVDLFVYWNAYKLQNKPIKRQEVGDLAVENFAFITPVDSDWAETMNEFFNLGSGYRSSNVYRNVLKKNLGNEVTSMLEIAHKNLITKNGKK